MGYNWERERERYIYIHTHRYDIHFFIIPSLCYQISGHINQLMQDFVYQPNESCWDIAFCSQGQGHRNDVQHEAKKKLMNSQVGAFTTKRMTWSQSFTNHKKHTHKYMHVTHTHTPFFFTCPFCTMPTTIFCFGISNLKCCQIDMSLIIYRCLVFFHQVTICHHSWVPNYHTNPKAICEGCNQHDVCIIQYTNKLNKRILWLLDRQVNERMGIGMQCKHIDQQTIMCWACLQKQKPSQFPWKGMDLWVWRHNLAYHAYLVCTWRMEHQPEFYTHIYIYKHHMEIHMSINNKYISSRYTCNEAPSKSIYNCLVWNFEVMRLLFFGGSPYRFTVLGARTGRL